MRGKLLAKTILIVLLVAWSLYALWPTYRLHTMPSEKKAEMSSAGKLVPLLNKSIKLGLDLQGGMYLTLDVDLPLLIEELAKVKDETLTRLIQQSREELNVSSEDFLTILNRNFVKANTPFNRYWGEYGDSNPKILDYLDKQAKDAMNRSLEILRNRIDQFGVSEPSIQHVGATRILPSSGNFPIRPAKNSGKTALLERHAQRTRRLQRPSTGSTRRLWIEGGRQDRDGRGGQRGRYRPDETSGRKRRTKRSVGNFRDSERRLPAETDTSVVVDETISRESVPLAETRTGRTRRERAGRERHRGQDYTAGDIQNWCRRMPGSCGRPTVQRRRQDFHELYLVKKRN
jgi:preprotein translocase subunit SecD